MIIKFNDATRSATLCDNNDKPIAQTLPISNDTDWQSVKERLAFELNPDNVKIATRANFEEKLADVKLPDGKTLPKDIQAIIMANKFPVAEKSE